MALLSDLVRIVAAVEGLEEVSVGIFARQAREAGLISQGGRGRSAAKMSIEDAANLLVAVNGCNLAKEVAERVPRIRSIPIDKNIPKLLEGFGDVAPLFGLNFERLIEHFMIKDGERRRGDILGETYIRFFKPTLRVDISMYPSGERGLEKVEITFGNDLLGYEDSTPDRHDEVVISHRTIRAVAEAL